MRVQWTIGALLLALGGPPLAAVFAERLLDDSASIGKSLPLDLALWAILAIILTVVVRAERQPLSSIGLRPPRWSTALWASVLVFVVTFALAPAVTWAVGKSGLPGFEHELSKLLKSPAWYRVFLAVTAGVVEEPLYRGYALERLSSLTGSYWLGGSIAVVAFGAAHIPVWGLGPALVAFVTGAVSTVFYVWKRDLVALIIAHVIGDMVGLVLLPAVPS